MAFNRMARRVIWGVNKNVIVNEIEKIDKMDFMADSVSVVMLVEI